MGASYTRRVEAELAGGVDGVRVGHVAVLIDLPVVPHRDPERAVAIVV